MKSRTVLVALPLLLCAGLAHAAPEPPAGAHADHQAHHAAAVPVDADHVRWTPDAPLMAGMRRAHGALERLDRAQSPDREQVLRMAGAVDDAVADMFANCELPTEPDVALHGLLARLMAGAAALREDPADREALAPMHAALEDYPRLFDDPGFPGPASHHPAH
ncbi:DnrO protein [Luteimonas sp. SJ-92]|uniref:DnrO protein n=1 Tax=Luteimonas salinisoli TaxID=2752307 RepID=A0A853JJA8_9GAMM|nr:DnrO protein [Luteimonas salinisoli]NZA28548.1 DnrO protein [Luteimonas salinisoli]